MCLDLTTDNEHDATVENELVTIKNLVAEAFDNKDQTALLEAISSYDKMTTTDIIDSNRARLIFQKAEALDLLAQLERSNKRLEQAISTFNQVLTLEKVSTDLFRDAGHKSVSLSKFRGWYTHAIETQKKIISKFPDSVDELNSLGILLLYMNQNSEAKVVFEQLLVKYPNDGIALVHLGFILKLEGSSNSKALDVNEQKKLQLTLEKGANYLEKGIATQTPGVLEGKFFFHLGDALKRLGKTIEADKVYEEAAKVGAIPSFWQRSLYNVNGLKAKPTWEVSELDVQNQLNTIKENWKLIRKEALDIFERNLYQVESENLSEMGRWAQFELYRQGRKVERNCKNAPITCSLIDKIPQISKNRRGQVKFSWMEAGTHIHAHSGPTNCRLRAHLGLKIPENLSSDENISESSTKLRVADQYVTWKDGEMFIFDDSFDHEVWHDNPQKESRLVLILDLWHPELTEYQKVTLPAI